MQVDIRNVELTYYVGFFNTISVQCIFIAGIQLAAAPTVVPLLANAKFGAVYQNTFQQLYWFFTIADIFMTVECLLVCV